MKHMYTEPHFMLSAAWLFQQPHLCWLFERLGCRLGSMLLLTQSCTFLVPYYVCQCWVPAEGMLVALLHNSALVSRNNKLWMRATAGIMQRLPATMS